MKVSTVLKPTLLFAAGSVAAGAHAAPTIDAGTPYSATFPGTDITLAGSSVAQYNFKANSDPMGLSAGGTYDLSGLNGAKVSNSASKSAANAMADIDLGTSVQTGVKDPSAFDMTAQNSYYGLRFASNGINYAGYAEVNSAGDTISEIGYERIAGAVPEPAAWALMIAGFGGVGLAMRRRRRQASVAAVA